MILLSGNFSKIYAQKNNKKPNIVFVLIDDMAWADVGYNGYNTFYETPNIDAIAKEGIIFNRFYPGGPNCAPTRASILTGMYTPRTKIYQPGGQAKGNPKDMRWYVPVKSRNNDEDVLDSRTTIAPEVTSIAEVMKTAGYVTSRIGKWHIGPDTQGFDESTSDGDAHPDKKFYNDKLATSRMTKSATAFFERNVDNPFFLYFSLWDVHTPLVAKSEIIEKYQKKWKTWPDKSFKWSPTYAAMIEVVDNSVGALRNKLKELKLDKNTLFIVASDNGGTGHHTSNLPLKGAKGAIYEGGIRSLATAVWPGHIKPGSTSNDPITGVDFMPTFAALGEGQLPTDQPVDGQSFAKLLKTGRKLKKRPIFWHYPLYLNGKDFKKGWPSDNVLPKYGTNNMIWRAVPTSAIMCGDWKLIYFYEYEKYELYNLSKDIGEQHDLSKSHPKKAAKMFNQLMEWIKETKADVPRKPNPDFKRG